MAFVHKDWIKVAHYFHISPFWGFHVKALCFCWHCLPAASTWPSLTSLSSFSHKAAWFQRRRATHTGYHKKQMGKRDREINITNNIDPHPWWRRMSWAQKQLDNPLYLVHAQDKLVIHVKYIHKCIHKFCSLLCQNRYYISIYYIYCD
jgi:hypothetical protein